jgi:hypothetical protein
MVVHVGKVVLRAAMAVFCCGVVQPQAFVRVTRRALAHLQHARQIVLCVAVTLRRCKFVQTNGFVTIASSPLAVLVPVGQRLRNREWEASESARCCMRQRT